MASLTAGRFCIWKKQHTRKAYFQPHHHVERRLGEGIADARIKMIYFVSLQLCAFALK
jgi:hypothetical protein